MLNRYDVMGFIPSVDPAKAKTFYIDVLGLTLVGESPAFVEVDANGTHIQIVATPGMKPQGMTILGWRVPDIEAAANEMIAKGIAFERYGFFEQDALGIWTAPSGTRVAWFLDPDGNTLSISQHKN